MAGLQIAGENENSGYNQNQTTYDIDVAGVGLDLV